MAEYALINRPFRPEAKQVYFDMIARQTRVNEATEVCLEQGWKDALPLIELVIEKPSSLGASRDAYTTYRQLSGKPIDPKLLQAAKSNPATMRLGSRLAPQGRRTGGRTTGVR